MDADFDFFDPVADLCEVDESSVFLPEGGTLGEGTIDSPVDGGVLEEAGETALVGGEELGGFVAHLEVRDYAIVMGRHVQRTN